jgi:hypothetical protein
MLNIKFVLSFVVISNPQTTNHEITKSMEIIPTTATSILAG